MATAFLALIGLCLLAAVARYLLIDESTIRFHSGNLQIEGTLLVPPLASNAPGVVLVHGSGPTTRRAMLLYARIFAFAGYAAVVYDKRGQGRSAGPADAWKYFSIDELAGDAAAALRLLRAQPAVDASKTGYFATSQGAWVAARAANQEPLPAFLVMVSASISTIREDRLFGMRALLRHKGFDEPSVERGVELLRLDQAVSLRGTGYAGLAQAFLSARAEPWFRAAFETQSPVSLQNLRRTWERSILEFDPRPHLLRLECPVLWVFGDPDFDRFAPVEQGIDWVNRQNGNHSVIVMRNADHNLNSVDSGPLTSLFGVRLPAIWRILRWLNAGSPIRAAPIGG